MALTGDEGRVNFAKSLGESEKDLDPGVSEWGNPIEQTSIICT